MYRTHTCGELSLNNENSHVSLSGWVQRSRDLGGMTFIDLRDRYGITQLVFNMDVSPELCDKARKLGREFVIQIEGVVSERSNKNTQIKTGDIEIIVTKLIILNPSLLPPFTIENETDGGDEIRMQYRYLDIRRNPIKENLLLRHKIAIETRNYLNKKDFIEVETPYLIKSTPEGARDFIVPSRMNKGEFYALPQSPQTFKQLLMVAGLDKYYQIVKCFRDEDLRSDRQPEFTQIDCELSFATQNDVLKNFEGLTKHLIKEIKGVSVDDFPIISYEEAIAKYGTDKPDIRFAMSFIELNKYAKGKGFNVFDSQELVVGICAKECASYSRKQLDELTNFVKKPQIGSKGLVWVKYNKDGTLKSSVDKFFTKDDLLTWAKKFDAEKGDLLLILSGEVKQTRTALSELRLYLANLLGLRNPNEFSPLWVVDFPLLEWSEEENRFFAMHHPFTSPKDEDLKLLEKNPKKVRANAYDLVLNGNEIGGGSIRIYNRDLQKKMFNILGFSEKEAQSQFGFLTDAFRYGAPPHGGMAFGFDRLVAILGGQEGIRDFIAFPKNNTGRDVMINAPSNIDESQLDELDLMFAKK